MEPVFGRRALLINGEKRTLVIADLHIGVEYELEKKGIRIPRQWENIAEEVKRLKCETEAEMLLINGDLKHGIPSEKGEFRDVRMFLREINGFFEEIHIVKGNHDGGLQYDVPERVNLHPGSGFVLEKIGIFHGHAWPSKDVMESNVLVMGHMHPAIRFTDSLGNSQGEPCWIKGKYGEKEIIVMPAMSKFYGGVAINEGKFLGPMLNSEEFDAENARIYLLDGTYMGKIGEIKKRGDGPSEVVG